VISAFGDHPWRLVFPVLAVGALIALGVAQRAGAWGRAYLASALLIAGLLSAGLYPRILPARDGRPHGLTVDNAASSDHALRTALVGWPVGIALAAVYFAFAYRMFFGRGRRVAPAPGATLADGPGGPS
jgi:cytochrome d ubiquinol oxidase subunit II